MGVSLHQNMRLQIQGPCQLVYIITICSLNHKVIGLPFKTRYCVRSKDKFSFLNYSVDPKEKEIGGIGETRKENEE